MKKNQLYKLQAERAAKSIEKWPKWMQDGITPPREQIGQHRAAVGHSLREVKLPRKV